MAEGRSSVLAVSSFSEDKQPPSGYPVSVFQEVPEPRYFCSHCKAVLKGALQTACGHCYCSDCLAWIVRNIKNPVCQSCKAEDPGFVESDESFLSVEKECSICEGVGWIPSETLAGCLTPKCNESEKQMPEDGKCLAEHFDAEDQVGCNCALTVISSEKCKQIPKPPGKMEHYSSAQPADKAKSVLPLSFSNGAFSDAALNKEILELGVRCGTPGCTWTGVMQTLEAHQSTCEHALVTCHTGCTQTMIHRYPAKISTDTIPCGDGTQKVSSDERDNPAAFSSDDRCLFSRIGCSFQGNREERRAHEKTAEGVHLVLLLQHVKQLKASLSLAGSRVSSCLTDTSKVLNGIFFSLHLQGALEVDTFSGLPIFEEDPGCLRLTRRTDGISLLETKLRVFENIASVLSKEMNASRQKIAAFRGQRGLDQDTIRGLELKIADLQRCLAQKDAALGRLQEKLQLSQQASYNGVFVWKIVDVHRKCYEAMCGKVCSLQSPAFYTARYGYRMCLRIFLNGEGRSRGSHVSLFLVLLKGDYDALLQWPFAQKITFMLLDQNGSEHLVNSFLADPSSAPFQRPVADMNEPSGCPRFLPLAKLRSPKYAYIKEGALFLKCIVEASL